MSTDELSTTSYAILGQLALRPWSAYDLTGQMQRTTVRQVWPRAESRIYAELKRIARLGHATVSREANGRRARSVYTITDSGRSALADWLRSDDATPYRLEDEVILRLSHGDSGTVEDLRRNIGRARQHLIERLEQSTPLTEELARGHGRFPERAHITALMAGTAYREMAFRVDLYDWLEAMVDDWTDTQPDPSKHDRALASLTADAAGMGRLLRRLRRDVSHR